MGIEALVVLRDVCALESSEAEEVLRGAARTVWGPTLYGPHTIRLTNRSLPNGV
jgi:hypothetical protein